MNMASTYQIKSTPFFRRMVSASKKNGQLQRLKDEYERIKDFNERTIEMRMRQVRLKRLYKEIDEIRESTMSIDQRRRLGHFERRKTAEELRNEAIIRAKELGKEYSRLNALMYDRLLVPLPLHFNTAPHQPDAQERHSKVMKERIVKSIDYGNEISRFNIRKMTQKKSKCWATPTASARTITNTNSFIGHKRDGPAKDTKGGNSNYNLSNRDLFIPGYSEEQRIEYFKKVDQLKQRLQYGNSWSSHNLSKLPKGKGKRINNFAGTEDKDTTSAFTMTVAHTTPTATLRNTPTVGRSSSRATSPPIQSLPTPAETSRADGDRASSQRYYDAKMEASEIYLKSLEELQITQMQMAAATVAATENTAKAMLNETPSQRAERLWRKLAMAVRNRSDILRIRKMQQQQLQQQQQLRIQHNQQQQFQQYQQHQQQQHQQQLNQKLHQEQREQQQQQLFDWEELHNRLLMEAAATKLPPEIEHELDSEPYDLDTADEEFDDLPLPPPPPPHDANVELSPFTTADDANSTDYTTTTAATSNDDFGDLSSKRHQFAKPVEGMVRDTATKEMFDSTVQGLRHIFESKQ